MKPLIHTLLNSRNPADRAKARRMARYPQLAEADAMMRTMSRTAAAAEKLAKDGAGPATGSPAIGADVYTPNAGRGATKPVRPKNYHGM